MQEKVFEELDYDECTEDQCIILIQEALQIENVFNLQIIGDEGNTQLSLKWINFDEKRNLEDYCINCATTELRERTILLVNNIVNELDQSRTFIKLNEVNLKSQKTISTLDNDSNQILEKKVHH